MSLHLSRIGRRWRIVAAVACLVLAAFTALADAGRGRSAVEPHSRPVLVAARALPVGHTIARRDLTTAHWPERLVPPGSATGRTAVGRVLAGPLARGEPVTSRRLVDPGLAAGLGADLVASPVDLDTDVRGLVRAGDRVDLLAVPRPDLAPSAGAADGRADSADSAARAVRVLAVLPPSAPASGLGADVGGCRLVLALARDQAVRIAELRPTRAFTVVVASP